MIHLNEKNKKIVINGSTILIITAVIGYFLYTKTTLNKEAILIAICCFPIIYCIAMTKYKIKYILASIGCGILLFLGTIGTMPLYQNPPEESGFEQTRALQYKTLTNSNHTELTIQDNKTTKTIKITPPEQKIYPGDSKQLILNLKDPDNTSILFIQFPDKTTIAVYPASTISLNKTGENQRIIEKIQGEIEYYKTTSGNKIEIKNTSPTSKKTAEQFIGKSLLQSYENDKKAYIIQQMGGEIMMNTSIRKLAKMLLDIAYQIRPNTYKTNLIHYQQYKQLLQWEDSNQQSYTNINSQIETHMLQEASKGLSETSLFKNWFK